MSQVGLVPDGAMIVRDDRIEWVGPTDRIPRTTGEVIDATGQVVMPGFVDAHTHVVFGGSRIHEFEMRCKGSSYEEIARAGGGIRSTVTQTRAQSEEELEEAAAERVRWMVAGGTTTIEAKSGYGLTFESELNILRVIRRLPALTGVSVAPTFMGAHAVPPEFEGREDDYVDLVIEEMLPVVGAEGLAEFCDMFYEEGYFTADDARRLMAAARRHGLRPKLHADQLRNSGGAVLAAELGAVTADHLEHTDQAGIEAMRKAGVFPVLLPGSVYALGLSKYAPARSMIAAGLPVVLATDFNPGSSPTPSMPMVLSLACTQMKMRPSEAVVAATINAAHSLGRGDRIGSLEPGKRADFAIHDCPDYRDLAYYFGFNRATMVFIEGRNALSI